MDEIYKALPFWSWNDELDENELVKQIEWMHENGIGGFFMHARGGLTTPYLGEKWFSCVEACLKKAKELGMEAYAYDENGWPSGFAGGKILEIEEYRDTYLSASVGPFDEKAYASFDISTDRLLPGKPGQECLNVYHHRSVSTADICNKKAVQEFLRLTHEEYKRHDIYGNLRGFFTDEPQYYRWGTAFTDCLPGEFLSRYGEDIKERIGLLFIEKEGYRDFRYKYWKTMQSLMLDSYGRQTYEWCDKHGYKVTGHYIEERSLYNQMACCGGIMPFYEYEHIPGMDWLGRNVDETDLAVKQLGSACAQLGKKQVITETFAMTGWDATPEELKHIAEYQYVGGPNLMCHHLLPYSEHGQRKRDYPEHFSKVNPWVDAHFKDFNDYFTVLGKRLSNSKEIVSVGVLHPIRSCYFNYKRKEIPNCVYDIDEGLRVLMRRLNADHIPYHYIDETLLAKHGSVEGSELVLGLCRYDVIILPRILTMDKTTEAMLRRYIENGGKVFLNDEKPTHLEGEPYDYDYLKANIAWDDIKAKVPYRFDAPASIRITYREGDEGRRFFYAVNLEGEAEATLNGVPLHFDRYESKLLYEDSLCEEKADEAEPIRLGKAFDVIGTPENYLTLDCCSFSKDGKTFSNPYPVMGLFEKLLKERYEGTLFLKYSFRSNIKPFSCRALIEDTRTKSVRVNGSEVEKAGTYLEKELWSYDIAPFLKEGENEIVIEVDYFQKENVYFALFGEGVTESLRNCLAYDTTIEAIYLQGDFGVYGDFEPGEQPNTFHGKDFYLDAPKKRIESLILDGYPMMRGTIVVEQEIDVKKGQTTLLVPERFQTIDVKVNGQDAGLMMFSHKLNVTPFLKEGKNVFTLAITLSNRNTMGPFHTVQDEDVSVTPVSFERMGSWHEEKSSRYREFYSFVKNLI